MAKKLPHTVQDNLAKCRSAAIAAVDSYNRPGPRFRTAQFIVLITIAWTALFHAIFFKRRRRPWYRKKTSGSGTGVRYEKIDGEPKHWDLSKCAKEYFGGKNSPESNNLEFLIRIRNKIEHRHLPEIDATLYGECQAALMNLEELLVKEFGQKYALLEQLAVSLQFSRIIPVEKKQALGTLASSASRSVTDYIERFRGNLPSAVLNSMKYSFNVYLVPRVVNREKAAEAAVQFISVDDADKAQIDRLEKLNVLIKEKHIPIANLDLFKPSKVVTQVIKRISYAFSIPKHTESWRHFRVRPAGGTAHPKRTRTEYCIYDEVHGDYLYTKAWIEMLCQELADPNKFKEITGWLAETS